MAYQSGHQTDLAQTLAENIVSLSYDDLPADVIDIARHSLVDTVATMVAANGAGQGCDAIVAMAREAGGREESTVVGYGLKVPCASAAFVNGGLSHAIDFDDAVDSTFIHPSVTTVPAALAMAERVGNVSGRQLLAAIALGNELILRLGAATIRRPGGYGREWAATCVFGRMSGAAAAGKLAGLNAESLRDALGIAFTQAGGTLQPSVGPGVILRGLWASFLNQQAIQSVQMAQSGITGTRQPLEGRAGLFNVYFDGHYDAEKLVGDWGKRFETREICFKPWPTCRVSHAYVGAVLQLVAENNLRPEEIEAVVVTVGERAQSLCEPAETRRKPSTVSEAKFSIPFIVASAFVRGAPRIGQFTLESIEDRATRAMATKVTYRMESRFDGIDRMPPARVEVRAYDGRLITKEVAYAFGNPLNPMQEEDFRAKIADCFASSAKGYSKSDAKMLTDLLWNVDKLESIEPLMARLA